MQTKTTGSFFSIILFFKWIISYQRNEIDGNLKIVSIQSWKTTILCC